MKKVLTVLALALTIGTAAYGLAQSVDAGAVTAQACQGSLACE